MGKSRDSRIREGGIGTLGFVVCGKKGKLGGIVQSS
jgi:hypothetical protein